MKNFILSHRRLSALIAGAAVVGVVILLFALLAGDDHAAHAREGTERVSVAGTRSGLAAADLNGDGIVYQSGMHPHIVRDEPGQCPICGMDLMPVRVDGAPEGLVEIDPVTVQSIGVRMVGVQVEALSRSVRTTGRFEANERGLTAVSPKVGGWVEQLHVDYEGARVRRGQPLLTIYSPELVSTQEEYLLALRNAERLGGSPDAQRLVDAARRRLAFWDITDAQIDALRETRTPQKTLTLYAPASGTVVRKSVVEGQQIMPGMTLLELSDLSRLWLMVDVYEQDLAWVNVGTRAKVSLPYDPGTEISSVVDYVYDTLDPATRTVKARLTLQNPGLQMKPGMYATVSLLGAPGTPHPVIPEEALIRTADGGIVVLAEGGGRFRPVEVVPGVSADGRVQILQGLAGGEKVVTSAQFLIDSEARLRSAVGAMMAGHNHGAPAGDGPPPVNSPREAAPASDHPVDAGTGPTSHTTTSDASTQRDAQVVRITVTPEGFQPANIALQAGRPARLVFTRETEQTCATSVQIPAMSVPPVELPLGTTVTIPITPRADGTYRFACDMDMVEGALLIGS